MLLENERKKKPKSNLLMETNDLKKEEILMKEERKIQSCPDRAE